MCSCDDDADYVVSGQHIYAGGEQLTVSRRDLLRGGVAAAIAGGAAALFAQTPAAAQTPPPPPGLGATNLGGVVFWGNNTGGVDPASILAERQGPSRTTGTKFKALVRHANTLTTETLTLLPLHPLHVVVRMQASQACYSGTGQLNTTNPAPFAVVAGHGGVGIVEEVGRLVKRVKVGDQVMIATTPNCGVCANCLAGRGDLCNTRLPAIPNATMSDNTPVYMTAPAMGPAGYGEFIVSDEDWIVPLFTKVPPVESSVLACVGGTGLGLAMCRFPIEAGADVAIFGLGPIGISAVQGARIQGAKTIIGIDPIKYRRDLALKLGATHVLDPNADTGNDLLAKIRALTTGSRACGTPLRGRAPGRADLRARSSRRDAASAAGEHRGAVRPDGHRAAAAGVDGGEERRLRADVQHRPSAGRERDVSRRAVGQRRQDARAGQLRRRAGAARSSAVRSVD